MIVPDVNLLVYAHNRRADDHELARKWWSDALTAEIEVGLPWAVALGFIRVSTHPAVLDRSYSPGEAVAVVRGWFESPAVRILEPGPSHLDVLQRIFVALGAAGRLTTDVHIAALAIEHRAELLSADADFSRFPGLRWRNPLKPA